EPRSRHRGARGRMAGQGRLGDKANATTDAHGCPACPHPSVGPGIIGSPNVYVNGRPALRVREAGNHPTRCGPNSWKAIKGSATVFINGKAAHRMGDTTQHCGGAGRLIEGSNDVFVGDAAGAGAAVAANATGADAAADTQTTASSSAPA